MKRLEKRRKKTPVVPWMHDHYGEETAGNTSTSNNAVQPEYRYENTGNMNNAGNMNNTGNQSNRTNNTVFCEPKYVYKDTYVERNVTYVHPIIQVNRQHVVNVPRHVYQRYEQNITVDPGIPDECDHCDE
ncbi:hypothetical protein [Heyndrickxia coagulans]|uniref:hypothetical protein n=1 Tax=Heyndrickxia coagulans TaxID=1398 RepID=UPI001F35F381|nr:hypothetical protein [Heyndrickxia coagulans]